MRIWDVSPEKLCRHHLLGEHSELHGLWTILTQNKKAYAHHPETRRWRGKLRALYLRHDRLVTEIESRGYKHKSALDAELATGAEVQNEYVQPYDEQVELLRNKGCGCAV
jgi:hypothetical protein